MSREPQSYSLDDLLLLMARLRDPNGGCPWDLKQTYETIAPSTIEEAYEVVDAIERKDYAHLKEELGDLVFQAIFYSQLAKEENLFNFADVIDVLVSKLIRRHPHVFPDGRLYSDPASAGLSEDAVKQNWEAIKSEERKEKGKTGLLADVPTGLPALTRALKLQKRAAQVGFDWPSVVGVCDKMREELAELESAIAAGERAEQEAELGDILFTCVNLARHLKIDPEAALRNANNKFSRRFSYMEDEAKQQQVELHNLSAAELDKWWENAKKAGETGLTDW
jgi:ATP diphosphatase